ncbi:MAG TPA: hypothetical protein VIS49_01460 [Cyclobacteriaceae bacterium]
MNEWWLIFVFIKGRIDKSAVALDRYKTKNILDFVCYTIIILALLFYVLKLF